MSWITEGSKNHGAEGGETAAEYSNVFHRRAWPCGVWGVRIKPYRGAGMLCHSVQSKATLQGLESVIGTPGNADEILGGAATVLRINYPMLIFDGLKKTMISLNRNTLGLKMNGKGVKLELMEPSGVELVRTRREPVHRNGKVELAYADVACPMAVYRIQAWRE